ncbi:MAG: flagellar brake protein [Lachnospiraceae bacterium]|nr:flagellar brake protein [Lachnospiraceae bacterium]
MIGDYINPGDRVEMVEVNRSLRDKEEKIYVSQVYDIKSDERIEIMMPMEKQKLVLLPQGAEYNLTFFSNNTLYQAISRVVDRYRTGNVYILAMDMTSNLRRFQRREYFRFSCMLQLSSRILDDDEVHLLDMDERLDIPQSPTQPLESSVIMDISGGGLRFVGNYCYEPGSMILCIYRLRMDNGEEKEYKIVSKILEVKEKEDHPGLFEHRAKYVDIDDEAREEIIRFIFEEERKNRKKQEGT